MLFWFLCWISRIQCLFNINLSQGKNKENNIEINFPICATFFIVPDKLDVADGKTFLIIQQYNAVLVTF